MLLSELKVIAVNGKFPGPLINATTNNNVVVNVHNELDEGLLLTWYCFNFFELLLECIAYFAYCNLKDASFFTT